MPKANRDGIVGEMLRVAAGTLVIVAAFATGCRDPSPDHQHHPNDGGSHEVDAAVVMALEARYLAVADTYATERCRCAADLPTCRREQQADWDEGGRACLDRAITADPSGFDSATSCLEIARDAFVACHTPYACGDINGRKACVDSFDSDGQKCLAMLSPDASGTLATCSPITPDAGP